MKRALPAASIDEYLAAVPAPERAALEKIRSAIRSAAPLAEEVISYGVPAFKHHGLLVAFAAFKAHCSFFPMSESVILSHAGDLASYSTAKGTIRFPAAKPLPEALVKRLVKARITENEARLRRKSEARRAGGHRAKTGGGAAAKPKK
jgi:uncharacterized protein YdhG (YjbR/CyaY superfamily)